MKFLSKFESQWAEPDNLSVVKTGEWREQRPVFKKDKCCRCGLCYLYCPVACIKDMGNYLAIQLDYCKGCGICARECPVNAINMLREI